MSAAEVIAEALAEHKAIKIPRPDAPRQCPGHVACQGCDWISRECGEVDPWDEHAAHQASVIAALPNIAVVSLPEPEQPASWHVTDWDGGRVSLCYGVDTVRCYIPNPALEVGEAEHLGIALIAASRELAAARAVGEP